MASTAYKASSAPIALFDASLSLFSASLRHLTQVFCTLVFSSDSYPQTRDQRPGLGPPLARPPSVTRHNSSLILIIAAACALWLSVAPPRDLNAQVPLGSERGDIAHFGGDIWSIATSPVHADHRAVVPGVSAGVAVVSAGAFVDSALYNWMTTHPGSLAVRFLSPIREDRRYPLYELGSGQYLLPLSAFLYASGRLSRSVALRDAGLGCAAGHLSSAALREVIYHIVARARPRITPHPNEISVPGSKNWDNHSFLSGHASNSMACASFAAHRFSLGVAEPLMYGYVGAIGLGRMLDGRHWFSDTMAGAMMGFAIGKGVADRQLHRNGALIAADAAGSRSSIPIIQWSIGF